MGTIYVDELKHQSAQGSGTITIGASGETVNVVGTLQNNGSAVGGTNTPAWSATNSVTQNISHDTLTKVNFGTEIIDTDSGYDTSTSKFTIPSGGAGKYYIFASIDWSVQVNPNYIRIYKNGSEIANAGWGSTGQSYILIVTTDLSVGDYLEVYTYQASGGTTGFSSDKAYFTGYKIIE